MQPEPTARDNVLLAAVLGGFALVVVVVGIAFCRFDRVLGAVLLLVGVVAVLYAGRLSAVKATLGERVPLWPGRNTLRPFTVRLWGIGVAVMGILMLAGI